MASDAHGSEGTGDRPDRPDQVFPPPRTQQPESGGTGPGTDGAPGGDPPGAASETVPGVGSGSPRGAGEPPGTPGEGAPGVAPPLSGPGYRAVPFDPDLLDPPAGARPPLADPRGAEPTLPPLPVGGQPAPPPAAEPTLPPVPVAGSPGVPPWGEPPAPAAPGEATVRFDPEAFGAPAAPAPGREAVPPTGTPLGPPTAQFPTAPPAGPFAAGPPAPQPPARAPGAAPQPYPGSSGDLTERFDTNPHEEPTLRGDPTLRAGTPSSLFESPDPAWSSQSGAGGRTPPGDRPPQGWGLLTAPEPSPRERRRSRIVVAVVTVLALVGAAVGAVFTIEPLGVALHLRPSPRELATKAGTAFLAGWQSGDYEAMQALVVDPKDDMARVYGGLNERLTVTRTVVQAGTLDSAGTGLPFSATLTLDKLGDVTWTGVVHLQKSGKVWKVRFTSDTVYPKLQKGQRLDLLTTSASRGRILDRNDKPLSGDADLAGNLVGKTGKNGGEASGLQRVLDDQLGGTPSTRLAIVDAIKGTTVDILQEWNSNAGTDVRTTIDLRMQRAAHDALSRVSGSAALVAIDTGTGEVRALASQPTSGLATAFASYYAPGSTFKIVTATAAMIAGATPQSDIHCSETINVNGRTFRNAEKAPSRTVSLTEAFAESCNTAFIRLGQQLPDGALKQAAELYGFNGPAPLPISSSGGRMPTPSGGTEAAADAIGQGKVEASPLQMASVAAAVASGTWRQPRVVSDCTDCVSHEIPAAAGVRPLMRAVVTSGTGTAVARVSGGPAYGKTGTAEFGGGSPPKTHAWFVGWQGEIAFAVFVHEGAYGGTVAAPIAAQFLNAVSGM